MKFVLESMETGSKPQKMIRFLLLLLLTFSLFLPATSQIILSEKTNDIFISPENSVFGTSHPGTSASNSYWIKCELSKQTEQPFLLECLSPHLKNIEVIIKDGINPEKIYNSGSHYEFRQRNLKHKNFVFPIPAGTGSYTIWIGLNDFREHDLYFKIRSYGFFTEYAISEYYFLGFYYGTLFIVLVYNLFLYLKGRFRLHLLYAFYIAGCILISLQEDGTGYQFFWPETPLLNEVLMEDLSKPLFLITFIVYSFSFLQIKNYYPQIKKVLVLTVPLYLTFSAISVWKENFRIASEWLFFINLSLIYLSSIKIALKGNKTAWYFFTGFSIIVISFLINIFRVLELIPSNILTVYIFNYGIVTEVLIFSIALADRFRMTEEERKKNKEALISQLHANDLLQKKLIQELEEKKVLQEKVNRELETRVRERTTELEQANKKLEEIAKERDRLNSELDKYNFSLQKEIREEKLNRIFHEAMSYEQFKQIYPDDSACLKAIASLKWPEGFICRKCGHDKAGKTSVWYRQKCTRCGYIESVTSHTIFHHLKFPLNKAFYLTYLEVAGIDLTNEVLSEKLELRKPTVWAFRNKISIIIREEKIPKTSNWKDMIVMKNP